MLEAPVVEAHLLQQLDDLILAFLVAPFGRARQFGALDQRRDALLLGLGDLLVGLGYRVEDREHARLQLRFHRRQRNRAFLALAVLAFGFRFGIEFRRFGPVRAFRVTL